MHTAKWKEDSWSLARGRLDKYCRIIVENTFFHVVAHFVLYINWPKGITHSALNDYRQSASEFKFNPHTDTINVQLAEPLASDDSIY